MTEVIIIEEGLLEVIVEDEATFVVEAEGAVGAQGVPGPAGPAGEVGYPTGGLVDEALVKASDADQDVTWVRMATLEEATALAIALGG